VVVATGCVANLFRSELEQLGPNVLVEPNKAEVPALALRELGLDECSVGDDGELAVTPTPTGRMRPGIKVQDGCDNRCTYCIVWKARGPARSLAPGKVISAVNEAVARGAHEVVLTGINLGSYQTGDGCRLPELLSKVLAETDIERVRLSSIEPPDVTERLLEVMAASRGRVAPFLHVCLQSGCDATLRRMARVYDTAFFRQAVERSRAYLPGIALGTDLIVGFPGETDADFEESLAFCRQMAFAKMHVFRYSKRPGTPAATAPGQVDPHVMAERGRRMRDLAAQMRHDQAALHVGELDKVLVEYPGRGVTSGLFDVVVAGNPALGDLVSARIVSVAGDGTLSAVPA
jgi:threonylcarbamoyladenosine tRNA methylthiotransferase MtaB